jgi:oxygen-independent coproporphyrinogen-3 oxidase
VHIPYCAHHCGYCDFAVAVGRDDHIDSYLDALAAEMSRLERPQAVDTLFFGGGTPTYLNHRQLAQVLETVRKWLPLLPGHEFSVEANPSNLDADKIKILADFGVNRVSLGAQSFDPALLRILERDHEPAAVPRAFDALKKRIANVSLDLIFGVPGQTVAQWRLDLDQAIELEPMHVATYGLTYEKGTRLWKQERAGEVRALEEETELDLYLCAMDVLAAADFEHYEISNFARAQGRCRHNQAYWANHAYFGFGVGAARYLRGVRQLNTRDLSTYIKRALGGRPTHFQSEELPPRERAFETVAVQLRRGEGVERASFREQTGFVLDALAGKSMGRLVELALLADDGRHVFLTRRGKCLADAVVQEILADQ